MCAILSAATLAVYAQVLHFNFVNFDDPDYVTSNFHVRAGLNAGSLAWAFGSAHASNWIPLTWLLHMANCQFFGLNAGMHHLTDVLIHLLSVLLLFGVLERMTGNVWPSAAVALLFGIHPLHAESVAWIAETKDVLCAFFWILTLCAYRYYTERRRFPRYLLVCLTFGFGLLSKPMIVTLPVALLLFDFWPLRRADPLPRLLLEKVPLLAMSACAAAIAFVAQQRGGAVIPLDAIPLSVRIGNAFISYATYLVQFFWPARLAAFYPYRSVLNPWEAAAAALAVVAISAAAWRLRREYPYLFCGWFWYLVALVPVIGIVQVGNQAHADRYAYIPSIGLSIALAWGFAEAVRRWPRIETAARIAAASACCALMAAAAVQASYWKDSEALFRHAIAVTPDNYQAYFGLGLALKNEGRTAEALKNYRKALQIRPGFPDAQNNLGEILLTQGHTDEAIPHLLEALRVQPAFSEAHVNMGLALEKLGRVPEAQREFTEAASLRPESAEAHAGLAAALEDRGRKDEALHELEQAVDLNPDVAAFHYNLGRLLGLMNRPDEAAAQLSEAIHLQPDDPASHYNLGMALADEGHLSDAASEFRKAIALNRNYAAAHFNLGSALGQLGHFDEAVAEFSDVLRLQPDFAGARESLETALSLRRQEEAGKSNSRDAEPSAVR